MAEFEVRSSTSRVARGRKSYEDSTVDESAIDTKTKRKRQRDDDDSSYDTSCDYGSRGKRKSARNSGSQWKKSELDALHVFYAKTPNSPTEILEKLKSCGSVDEAVYRANAMKFFQCLLKKKLSFSQDVTMYEQVLQDARNGRSVRELKQKVETAFDEMKTFWEETTEWLFSSSHETELPALLEEFHINLTSEEQDFVKKLVHQPHCNWNWTSTQLKC